jgi:hypothetical protein
MLDSRARDLLPGARETTTEELERERAELTPAAVAEAVGAALASLLVLIPGDTERSAGERFTAYDPATVDAVDGTTYKPGGPWGPAAQDQRLVVGADGVTLIDGDGPLTVRYGDCAAAVSNLSGRLTLVDRSGAWVDVVPSFYERGDAALASVRDALDPELVVPMTDREAELEPVLREQLEDGFGAAPREVDALPVLLGHDETPEHAAIAIVEQLAGLLVLTERRLLFVVWGPEGNDVLDLRRGEVSARTKGLLRKKLVVESGDDSYAFTNVYPVERAGDFAEALA